VDKLDNFLIDLLSKGYECYIKGTITGYKVNYMPFEIQEELV